MKYQIPGKTFLTGEYSVLVGGAALGLAAKPYFEVSFTKQEKQAFHPESAAGKFLEKQKLNYQISFEDGYANQNIQGGFGRSGAEFLAVTLPEKKTFPEILKNYQRSTEDQKVKPSGADLAFQYFGRVCLADLSKNEYESFDWPFPNLHFFIVSTGLKVKTHQHLEELDLLKIKHLPQISDRVIQSFLEKKDAEFVENLKLWSLELKKCGLQLEESWQMKLKLEKQQDVLLVKPCGALGADVLLVFCYEKNKSKIEKLINFENLKIISQNQDLSKGLASYVG